jgi:hypothetical protein
MDNPILWWGIPAGDLIQAASNIVGVALTVVVTLWLVGAPDRRKRRQLKRAIFNLGLEAGRVVVKLPVFGADGAHETSARMQRALIATIDLYRFVRAEVSVRTQGEWEALTQIDDAIVQAESKLRRELALITDQGQHEGVYAINRADVRERARAIAQAVNKAEEML